MTTSIARAATEPTTSRAWFRRAHVVEHEFSLARRSASEAIGTFLLVFLGVGSVPAVLSASQQAYSGAELGVIALMFGFIIAAAVYVLGKVSCHINPALTVSLAACGRLDWTDVPPYVVAQLVGATLGALAIWAVFAHRATQFAYGLGVTHFGRSVSWPSALLAEGLGMACLVFVVMGMIDKRTPVGWAGLIIGLTVTVIVVTLGPVTGGSVNPARSFGPLLVSTIASSSHNWLQYLGYVAAQIVGGVVGGLSYLVVAPSFQGPPAEEGASRGT
jgi:glycerol uptake facilitator